MFGEYTDSLSNFAKKKIFFSANIQFVLNFISMRTSSRFYRVQLRWAVAQDPSGRVLPVDSDNVMLRQGRFKDYLYARL